MRPKDAILTMLGELPESTTYADAFAALRPLYDREVAPIIAQYGIPPRPQGTWRREITGAAEAGVQKTVGTTKTELLQQIQALPEDFNAAEFVDEAVYRLVLSYSMDKAIEQIAAGTGIPHEELKHHVAQRHG